MERLMGLHEDVMRVLTIKVDAHVEGPSVQMQKRDERDRGDRPEGGFGGGERRERSFGGDRERSGGFGGGGFGGGDRERSGGFGGERSSAPRR
jgi:small subunit ribosomal protein S6